MSQFCTVVSYPIYTCDFYSCMSARQTSYLRLRSPRRTVTSSVIRGAWSLCILGSHFELRLKKKLKKKISDENQNYGVCRKTAEFECTFVPRRWKKWFKSWISIFRYSTVSSFALQECKKREIQKMLWPLGIMQKVCTPAGIVISIRLAGIQLFWNNELDNEKRPGA